MKAALHPFTAVLFHVASFALYPFGSRNKIFIITAHWLSLCVCTYPFVWICLSSSVCVVYMQPCMRTPTHVFVQMPFCGMSCLSVGYTSALESWCLTLQPQHHSVYLISVFACSLKLPRRKKGFVMWTMCGYRCTSERLKQQGTQKVWLHLPTYFTLYLMSDMRLSVCEMLSAPRHPARPKMTIDTRDRYDFGLCKSSRPSWLKQKLWCTSFLTTKSHFAPWGFEE